MATEAQERSAFAAIHKKIAVGIIQLMASMLADGAGPDIAASEAQAILGEMSDCARRMPAGFWSGLDPREPIACIRRVHAQWMEAAAAAEILKDPAVAQPWEALLPEAASFAGAKAAELLTARDLRREGNQMSHCVSSYAPDCQFGRSRIFSLASESGERSTLELAPFNGALRLPGAPTLAQTAAQATHWSCVQHLGRFNRPVSDPALIQAASALAELANRHWAARRDAARASAADPKPGPR